VERTLVEVPIQEVVITAAVITVEDTMVAAMRAISTAVAGAEGTTTRAPIMAAENQEAMIEGVESRVVMDAGAESPAGTIAEAGSRVLVMTAAEIAAVTAAGTAATSARRRPTQARRGAACAPFHHAKKLLQITDELGIPALQQCLLGVHQDLRRRFERR
jgi:hypothetical protein